jgi:hypothetical protein
MEEKILDKLISYWQQENIEIISANKEKLNNYFKNTVLDRLPKDFEEFFLKVNGMPMYEDKNGFLFYPYQHINSASIEFNKKQPLPKDEIYLFADYMTNCCWYGFRIISTKKYEIGIVPNANLKSFKFITNSLFDFLDLYMKDDKKLYEY